MTIARSQGRSTVKKGSSSLIQAWSAHTGTRRRAHRATIADPASSCASSLRYGQALGEQLDDVAPGPLGVPRVVADAGEQDLVGPDDRVVEGVQSAAVDHHAPIDAPSLHL